MNIKINVAHFLKVLLSKLSLLYMINLFNKLPKFVKGETNLKTFKNTLKQMLYYKSNFNIDDYFPCIHEYYTRLKTNS